MRGFEQQVGLDYRETFTFVVKPMCYKALFAIAAALDLNIEQMDVRIALFYGQVQEEIYVEQPPLYNDGTNRICLLKKALYGLKQVPRIWFYTLSMLLENLGFTPLAADMAVYLRQHTYIIVCVDNLLIVGPSIIEIRQVKTHLSKKFYMTDLGACHYYLGISVHRNRALRTLSLGQQGYIEKVLLEFGIWQSKPVATPMDTS